ncbi:MULTISPECIES: AAA family ATPase [Cyanophyceae]|uniref:AAA family ATPase n=1 Tax=Cyanophyceae TaxID=3028117 RepID=UPI0016842A72|nr:MULTISPECIES: AAA family ATPase [Cyanophyceae]MBD1918479.1 AAA family ATPase [Phormidium sp. FACHB-77]MBD2031368.1 AAA family ATPase [Phormidium sp. FACHB-322]MBD2049488.1 AAA family ATPase [Leptolyngbya sp. FACHB-60]
MARISIVGPTGSGKTTLARQVAQRCLLSHVELDALQWEPNWTPAEPQVFRDRVTAALSGDRWVVDGNYSAVRDIVWGRDDTVVFLDYPFGLVMGRLLRRTWRRSLHREELWNGNRETFRQSFFSRDSILVWLLRTYWKKRKQYPALFRQSEYAHLSPVHLRSPKAAEKWLLSYKQHLL